MGERKIFERVMELGSRPSKTVVYVTPAQVAEIRAGFTWQGWLECVRDARSLETFDKLDVAYIGNALIRLKEPPAADPAIVDLTEEK